MANIDKNVYALDRNVFVLDTYVIALDENVYALVMDVFALDRNVYALDDGAITSSNRTPLASSSTHELRDFCKIMGMVMMD